VNSRSNKTGHLSAQGADGGAGIPPKNRV
jgi:hypothetical protein